LNFTGKNMPKINFINDKIENKILLDILLKTDLEIIAYFDDTMTGIVANAPRNGYKEIYLHKFLDDYFSCKKFDKSFTNKLLIVYDETLSPEIMIALHNWFKKQCCKMSNLILISTHTLNLNEWYNKYCDLTLQSGFTVIDTPLAFYFDKLLHNTQSIENYKIKNLQHYFTYFGGTYSTAERDFTTACVMLYKNLGHIDYIGGYVSTNKEFDNFLEEITEFQDRSLCDKLMAARKAYEWPNNSISPDETIKLSYFEKNVYNKVSAFNLTRETFNSFPYCIFTEKSIKTFLDMQIILPIGYHSVDLIKKNGFIFLEDLIDYNYQHEKKLHYRLLAALEQIKKISKNYTLPQLAEKLYDSRDIFLYNLNYIASGEFYKNSARNLVKKIYA